MAPSLRIASIAGRVAPLAKAFARGTIYIGTAGLILYGSPVTDIVLHRLYPDAYVVSPPTLDAVWGAAGYFAAWGLLAVLTLCTLQRVSRQAVGWGFVLAMTVVSLLYLMDVFLSTDPMMLYQQRVWVYLVIAVFFVVLSLFHDEWQRVTLLDFMLLCIGNQAVFAIVYYALDINQFVTPGFGRRTSGTFFNPNVLYPLTLMGAIVAFHRAMHEDERTMRWILRSVGWLSAIATLLTFTRIAWIALAVALVSFTAVYRERLSSLQRTLLLVGALLLVMSTFFVRTKGQLMGGPQDRSFWGRWQIWDVSLRIVQNKPFLGHGFQTYLQKRNEFMTPGLRAFGPLNTEAKSLLLNIAVEFGLAGVAVFVWVGVAFRADDAPDEVP